MFFRTGVRGLGLGFRARVRGPLLYQRPLPEELVPFSFSFFFLLFFLLSHSLSWPLFSLTPCRTSDQPFGSHITLSSSLLLPPCHGQCLHFYGGEDFTQPLPPSSVRVEFRIQYDDLAMRASLCSITIHSSSISVSRFGHYGARVYISIFFCRTEESSRILGVLDVDGRVESTV